MQPLRFLLSAAAALALVAVPFSASAQDLYMPSEIEQAYKKGTRSPDGKPGPNYWQNHARYDMDVRLEPADRAVSGSSRITYINNSPDDLLRIVLRLKQDVYKRGAARDRPQPEENLTDGVNISGLSLNGNTLDPDRAAFRNGTQMLLNLPTPLPAGDSLELTVAWDYVLPTRGIRTGAYDSTSFFVGYWYPQVAVYDDVYGWDTDSYTGQVETYNGLADYDVRITVPDNFLVHGTGMLQNPEEVFPDELLDTYRLAAESEEVRMLIDAETAGSGFQMKGETWHYRARDVPDFAFFTSDHYIWEVSSIEVADRRVMIHTIYPPQNAAAFAEVSRIQQEAMAFFSTQVSGIPYPYPSYASINAYTGGGMEFPMLANNAAPPNEQSMASLTAHEMHHMYFPFYVRINEKKFAWMDEGWADYITDLALGEGGLYGAEYAQQAEQRVNSILRGSLKTPSRVPLMTPSTSLSGENYGYLTYMYAHLSYSALHDILGHDTFVEAFREYISRWAYKSPTPYDFFNTFEDVAGEDLDWFWESWYFTFAAPDLAIADIDGRTITVRRDGRLPVGVEVDVHYADGSTETLREPLTVWKEGATEIELRMGKDEPYNKVLLNASIVDVDDSDNIKLSEAAIAAIGDLSRFAGTYSVNPQLQMRIVPGTDRLNVYIDEYNFETAVFPEEAMIFSTPDGAFSLQFREDGEGNIGFLSANAFGNEMDARKVR